MSTFGSKIYQKSLVDNRVLVTPHVGGATKDAWEITEKFLADKLMIWLKEVI